MARIAQQAVAGTPAVVVPHGSKMRFRPRLPSNMKVQRAESRPQTADVLVRFSINMPRQIRSRISNPRTFKLQRTASESSDGSNHEVVLSPTGRFAMGPWMGPFECCDSNTDPDVYFVDGEGVAHLTLLSQAEEVQDLPKRSPASSVDAAMSSVRRAHMAEVRQAHSKFSTHKNWPTRRSARSAARMNQVFQPRGQY